MIESAVIDRIAQLTTLCKQRGQTVALAESCTGGLLASWICSQPGVSRFFKGAVVSYSGAVKHLSLGVAPSLMKSHGEVSLPVARAMATGCRERLESDWAVSITGVAGPDGGSPEKPVGFVCFAVAGPGLVEAVQKQFAVSGAAMGAGAAGRQDIQRQAALFAFDLLLNAMR